MKDILKREQDRDLNKRLGLIDEELEYSNQESETPSSASRQTSNKNSSDNVLDMGRNHKMQNFIRSFSQTGNDSSKPRGLAEGTKKLE